jgi:membrane associated rhomboid family serine protease
MSSVATPLHRLPDLVRAWFRERPLRPAETPFVALYLVVSWAIYLPLVRPRGGRFSVDKGPFEDLLYAIPDLSEDRLGVLRSLAASPFLNHNLLQLLYVTSLLFLFGAAVERDLGARRTALFFFGTTLAGAIVAGLLLHLIYPDLSARPIFVRAWEKTWSGGSAGCFGLMGVLAARSPRPGRLLVLFVAWELVVLLAYLRNYTSAFHLIALATGFLVTRYLPLVGREAEGRDAAQVAT